MVLLSYPHKFHFVSYRCAVLILPTIRSYLLEAFGFNICKQFHGRVTVYRFQVLFLNYVVKLLCLRSVSSYLF